MSVAPWPWMIGELRRAVGLGAFLALAAFILGPLLTLLVWAFAGSWLFPNRLPEFSLKGGADVLDNANVVKTDILATNGVIHVIDAVILPQ